MARFLLTGVPALVAAHRIFGGEGHLPMSPDADGILQSLVTRLYRLRFVCVVTTTPSSPVCARGTCQKRFVRGCADPSAPVAGDPFDDDAASIRPAFPDFASAAIRGADHHRLAVDSEQRMTSSTHQELRSSAAWAVNNISSAAWRVRAIATRCC